MGAGISKDRSGFFTEKGLKNFGELIGKTVVAGLGVSGAIIGAALGGPLGFAAALPGAIKSTISLGASLYDMIETRDITGDLNKTADDILSSDFGKVLTGLDLAGSAFGLGSAVPKAARNLSNIAMRGTGVTAISELARIAAPVKEALKFGGPIGNIARTATKVADLTLNGVTRVGIAAPASLTGAQIPQSLIPVNPFPVK